jgi:nicotinamidase-related amidase
MGQHAYIDRRNLSGINAITMQKQMPFSTLKEIVDPEHTCLVVWDVQNALVNAIFNREQFLKSLKALITSARKNSVLIVYTKITPLPLAVDSPWRIYTMMKRFGVDDPAKLRPWLVPGSPEAEIPDEVKPAENDLVINKHTASVFIGTHFKYLMMNRGIKTILFAGISTEIGIASSARDASNRGFYPLVLSDCVSSSDKDMHEMALKVLPRVCLVMPSMDVMENWK